MKTHKERVQLSVYEKAQENLEFFKRKYIAGCDLISDNPKLYLTDMETGEVTEVDKEHYNAIMPLLAPRLNERNTPKGIIVVLGTGGEYPWGNQKGQQFKMMWDNEHPD